MGSLSLLQRIFPTQGSNPGLPHCGWSLYPLSHKGSHSGLELPHGELGSSHPWDLPSLEVSRLKWGGLCGSLFTSSYSMCWVVADLERAGPVPAAAAAESLQSCPTLCSLMDYTALEFSRPEHWSGEPFPSLEDLPNSGIKPRSPALQVDSLLAKPQRCSSRA